MELTVCICAHDRPDHLKSALESLRAARDRGEGRGVGWEILVVASGGSSRTEAVARSPEAEGVRHVVEPEPGLSRARNRAVREARGGCVLFLDDDAVVRPGYLDAYADGFERYPEAAFFGGPIRARIDGVDARLLEAVRLAAPGTLSWLEPDRPEGRVPTDGSFLPWGANMAIRVPSLDGRRFDPNVGRHPERPHGAGEETLLFLDLLEAGEQGVWLPDACVDHHVDAQRCSTRNIRDHSRGVGWSLGYRAARQGKEPPRVARARVTRTLRRMRIRTWWAALSRAPLRERLRTLHELEVQKGWWEGYRATLTAIRGTA